MGRRESLTGTPRLAAPWPSRVHRSARVPGRAAHGLWPHSAWGFVHTAMADTQARHRARPGPGAPGASRRLPVVRQADPGGGITPLLRVLRGWRGHCRPAFLPSYPEELFGRSTQTHLLQGAPCAPGAGQVPARRSDVQGRSLEGLSHLEGETQITPDWKMVLR